MFRARYADHRLMGSMLGNMAVYFALTQPGDVIMSIALEPFGGHSSNRPDGPAGVRGLKIVDIPMDPVELEVDLDLFKKMAPLVQPNLVTLGVSMTLFPFPIQEMSAVIGEWGGRLSGAGLAAGRLELGRDAPASTLAARMERVVAAYPMVVAQVGGPPLRIDVRYLNGLAASRPMKAR